MRAYDLAVAIGTASIATASIGVAPARAVPAAIAAVAPAPAPTKSVVSGSFTLADRTGAAPIVVDPGDAKVVRIAADMLAGDVASVTGQTPEIIARRSDARSVIVAGTIGHSAAIDDLVARGRVDPVGVTGVWEAYRIVRVANPWPGVAQALVIVGADRRGTAYGLLSLSRAIGVSPWTWWSDVRAPRQDAAQVTIDGDVVAPSVRYRGIFINDEDWSLRRWAETNFDRDRGNIGPKTYERVFALLLRLRANTLWPAMHPGSLAFNQDPENAALADRYGIVMGASHAEPMLRNNVAEWDASRLGAFDFASNASVVTKYWEDRARANGRYENLYTVGMRGIHDTPVIAGETVDRTKLLERVVDVQRGLIARYVAPDAAKVPQVFVPYKEVLGLYRKGMVLPADVTLGWGDDNFGYIRQLSTPVEQARPGGSGVYYHISYWGSPSSYLWLSTTPPALIGSEMRRAWDTNARRLWIANVGDIKPAEIDTEYFLDLAWDYGRVSTKDQTTYLHEWATRTFGAAQGAAIGALLGEHYRLGFIRKPEHMDFSHDDVGVQPTQFSPVAYGDEAGTCVAEYAALLQRATDVEARLTAEQRDAYYQLVLYPITGARWMAEKALMADRSYLAAWQGRASADSYAALSHAALAAIHAATARYNAIGDGKWRGFMNDDPRNQAVFAGLPTGSAATAAIPGLGIAVEGSVDALVRAPATPRADYADRVERWRTAGIRSDTLPAFDRATRTPHFIDLFNTGTGTLDYRITANVPWVTIAEPAGSLQSELRTWINIDWRKVPAGARSAIVSIEGGAPGARRETYAVTVPLDTDRAHDAGAGTIVAIDGVVAVEAEHFVRKTDSGGKGWTTTSSLGRVGGAIETRADVPSRPDTMGAPFVDYAFQTDRSGKAVLTVAALPTFPLDRDHMLRYAVSIDGAPPQIVDIDAGRTWSEDVVRNARYTSSDWVLKPGRRHSIRLWALDPALVIDRLTLDFGGKRTAYLGPSETRVAP